MAKPTKKEIAEAILAMSYGELIAVADGILAVQRKRALSTREDLASLLHEWAEGQ